jgi:hypothetical protein
LRKWSVAVLGIGLAFALAILGKLTGDFTAVVIGVVGAFHASNAYTTGAGNEGK